MPKNIRFIVAAIVICVFQFLWTPSSIAQTSENSDAAQHTEQTLAQDPETVPVDTVSEVDEALSGDERLLELARQKIEADKAYYEALSQSADPEEITPAELDETEIEDKPSLFNPENMKAKAQEIWEKLLEWLKSPAFLAMVGAIVLSYILAPLIARILRKRLFFFRDPPAAGVKLKAARDLVYRSGNFLRAAIFVLLLTIAAAIVKPAFGEDWLVKIAQSIAIVFLLYKAIKEFVPNDLIRKLATWIAIPVALITVMGGLPDLVNWLENTPIIPMGETPITAMTLIRLAVFGGLFFWLGNKGNAKGQDAIRAQEGMDAATREIVSKLFQMLLFAVVVILVMSFAGIPLSGLVMIMSAVGLGIGLGLQPVAANFVSGIIILFDRSVRKGDFIVLPEGQEGYVEAINMRSTTVETTDGKDIMVPNTVFIDNTYENWTHTDPAQRYEVYFKVPYDTDIDTLEDILIPVIENYPKVLMEPEEPDLELREFGEYGIHFAIEFWVSGIDDGENKFTSDLNYIVWRTLKENGIRMPIPIREVKNL